MTDRLVLAIDTSFGPVGAALATFDRRVVAFVQADNPAGTQAETLPPIVQKMLDGRDPKAIGRIAVTVGPGAFTGVRVGLAFAKGLKLATGAEVLGFTTLECLAAQAEDDIPWTSIGVAIDAKRGEVYVQAFSRLREPLCEAALLPIAEASQLLKGVLRPRAILTGSGAALLEGIDERIVRSDRIDAHLLARLAVDADPAAYPATPAYLRAPDARLPS